MNDPSQMMNRSFGMWPAPPPPAEDHMGFSSQTRPAPPPPPFAVPVGGAKPGRMNWKGKKPTDKRKKVPAPAGGGPAGAGMVPHGAVRFVGGGGGPGVAGGSVSVYNPPTLNELQFQNRVKARRFYPKKKFTRFAPFAPRNTSSFIIRAKRSGGIASLVSPCPVTPAILPTPKFSPTREGLVDMAKEEWGVDGYGSMKGLIRLRSPNGYEIRPGGGGGEEEDDDEEGSSESDVEEHLEVERRLDHDLSRFEMVYPADEHVPGANAYLLENRVDDQDSHIAQLEEENLTLKERLFLMEREMADMRRRLQLLETQCRERDENNNNYGNNSNNDNNNDNGIAIEAASENDAGGDVSSEKSVGDCEESSGTPMHE